MFILCIYPRARKAFRFPFFAYGISDDPSKISGVLKPKVAGGDITGTLKYKAGEKQWVLTFPINQLAAGARYHLLLSYDAQVRVTVENVRVPRPKGASLLTASGFEIDSPSEGATVASHTSFVATGRVDNGKRLDTAFLEYLDAGASFEGQAIDDGLSTGTWIAGFTCQGMTGNQAVRLTVTDNTTSGVRTDSREFTLTDGDQGAEGGE